MGNVRNGVVILFFLVLGAFAKYSLGSVLGVNNVEKTDSTWTMLVGGDVMLGRSVNTRSIKYKDFNFPFLKIRDYLSSADLTMVNLETPVTEKCSPTDSGMIFCAPNESLVGLKWSGVDVVNLDNNHTLNHGDNGYEQTKKYLTQYGLSYFDDENFYLNEIKGVKVGVLGFDLVSNHRSERIQKMLALVSQKAEICDLLVVNLHWGEEYVNIPSDWMRNIAKDLVVNGTDLIVGHHSHVIGGYEEIEGVPVIYSLGNLVFDQMWSEETRLGMMMKFTYEGTRLVGKEYSPVKIYDYGQPRLVDNISDKNKLIEAFLSYSQQGSL
jgi:poly-gamma-glutamate capsule biosynthesis protein CapA/YwtB (metallophosphatase superfamily)